MTDLPQPDSASRCGTYVHAETPHAVPDQDGCGPCDTCDGEGSRSVRHYPDDSGFHEMVGEECGDCMGYGMLDHETGKPVAYIAHPAGDKQPALWAKGRIVGGWLQSS